MSNLIDHARRELERAGLFDDDSDYNGNTAKAVMDLIEVFSKQGHSGSSAHMVSELFNKLSRYEPLTPITDDPAEWHNHGLLSGGWQNRRSGAFFSDDAGKTYYSVNEPKKYPRLWAILPRSIRVWLWGNHRSWVQPIHTSKISGIKAKENA